MSKEIAVRIVIDTNVLVPSIYQATHLFNFILAGNLVVVWNDFIYEEAREIIVRLEGRYKRIGLETSDIIQLLNLIHEAGIKVPDMPADWPPCSPDRDGDPFLWAALKGEAEFIISEDKRHMVALKEFQGIPIGTPKKFFEWVKIAHPME